ncbi:MAG: imidazole glycerol phosphate synthase subunit HisH [Bacteroidetes bacterium]|nr:MAG: imidazole glycerol phosphate synthase subunit HisH [Bacteroidota bacterium]
MLVIVDYGVGNLESIRNMLKKTGTESTISSDQNIILEASKLILPGVGAFDTCASKLKQSGLIHAINQKVKEEKTPILGVCVGLQLLLEGSEEGVLPGLGWIKGKVVRFKQERMNGGFKIPHMGWSEVELPRSSSLFKDLDIRPRFYFVHSYYPELVDEYDALVYANYGYPFVAGVEHENILGVQFHPEKSHKFGMKLLDNFVKNY